MTDRQFIYKVFVLSNRGARACGDAFGPYACRDCLTEEKTVSSMNEKGAKAPDRVSLRGTHHSDNPHGGEKGG